MYRIKISGNFLVLLNDEDISEHSRHPLIDSDYESFEDLSADPLIRFTGINKPLKARGNLVEFRFSTLLDANGNTFISYLALIAFLNKHIGGSISTVSTVLGRDVGGRMKTTIDLSVFNSLFTYSVPRSIWFESLNDVEKLAFELATSSGGRLNLESGSVLNDLVQLQSFRSPKYQPSRGYLYSTSVNLPNPEAAGVRRFGFFTKESGVFFELSSSGLYGVVRTSTDGVVSDSRGLIRIEEVDLNRSNLYDIQMQWRGEGEYNFIINNEIALKVELKNTSVNSVVFNPTNPITFECENLGENVSMQSSCVDVTNEGGKESLKSYGNLGVTTENGQVTSTGFNTPIMAIRNTLRFNDILNTRDVLLMGVNWYADNVAVIRIWRTRDFLAITPRTQEWEDYRGGNLQYIEYDDYNPLTNADSMQFDITKASLIYTSVINSLDSKNKYLLFEENAKIYMHPGDMFVFTIHESGGGTLGSGLAVEFAEEI